MEKLSRKIYFWIYCIGSCLWVFGSLFALLFRLFHFENGTVMFTLFIRYFDLAMFRTLLLPIELILFIIFLVTDLFRRTPLKRIIKNLSIPLLSFALWALYICLFISVTGF